MPSKVSPGFSFFGIGGLFSSEEKTADASENSLKKELFPSMKLQTNKDVYMPGEFVDIIIEVHNPEVSNSSSVYGNEADEVFSLLIERLTFEMKGVEKLDSQWVATQKPSPESKQRRGEHVFLDCSTPSLFSNQIVSSGGTKKYVVRTELPSIIPPTYRGTTVRYLYYVRSTLSARWRLLENGHSRQGSMKDLLQLEARIPVQIWVTQKTSGLLIEEGQGNGILPASTIQMDMYWKEKDEDTEWVRANETPDGIEEGYDSSRDEVSSVSSYNPTRGNLDLALRSSLSLQSSGARSSNRDALYAHGERSSLSSYVAVPRLSVAEVLYDSSGDILSPRKKSSPVASLNHQRKHPDPFSAYAGAGVPPAPGTIEPVASEGFIRGRSYNIRLDDQVLLRFSPKNSDSTYYFGDAIGGTLTFFHDEGARRCLEVAITLEISETISQRIVHPSRRNSPTITKVQSDHYEVVADLVQTSFLFSIPMDGPMSFSTSHVSVRWALRFEFLTSPKNVDWTKASILARLGIGKDSCFNCVPSVSMLPSAYSSSHTFVVELYAKSDTVGLHRDKYYYLSRCNPTVSDCTRQKTGIKYRYDHPLLIEGRDKGEWVLPITVHAPYARAQNAHTRNEKPVSLAPIWVHT